ncbi:MAG TPA: MCE family protein [Acidimicrobiales bacterium]
MTGRRNLLRRVGLVLAAGLISASCSVIGLGGGDTYRVTAYFDRTISLFPTSPVRVLGLPAGTVRSIDIEDDRVRVEIDIPADVPLPADVQATIVPLSLIGERFVQLFPAWTEGQAQAADGHVIGLDRTIVPVEPDEALEAIKEFLDTLNPDATSRLIDNLASAVDGQGPTLNSAIGELSQLASTLASKSDTLGRLIDQFDDFTATVVTRESQLGEVMETFAEAVAVLAQERDSIAGLVEALGDVSGDILDLVVKHGDNLETDLRILGRTLRSATASLDAVGDLLDAGPGFATGLRAAFNEDGSYTDLRNQTSPTVGQLLDPFLGELEFDVICLPIDVACGPAPASAQPGPSPAAPPEDPTAVTVQPTAAAQRTSLTPAAAVVPTPIDALFDLLDTGTATRSGPPSSPARGFWQALADRLMGVAT